jgi:hypothetical protein
MTRRTRSLTLIEGQIIAGIFIFLAILVIPFVKGARICANEREAVEMLQEINRSIEAGGEAREAARKRLARLIEPILRKRPDLKLIERAGGEPFISHHGYLFRLGLDPESETFSGRIIAWPREIDDSGTAAFFIDEEGILCYTHNLQRRYSGTTIHPRLDAALPRDENVKPTPRAETVTGLKKETHSFIGRDGERWTPFIP